MILLSILSPATISVLKVLFFSIWIFNSISPRLNFQHRINHKYLPLPLFDISITKDIFVLRNLILSPNLNLGALGFISISSMKTEDSPSVSFLPIE